jgi:DNA-binding LacI/PurR family transcriptional regulator
MATINDVARAASVSTATVSAVVNESAFVSPQLRARVLAAMALMGLPTGVQGKTDGWVRQPPPQRIGGECPT